MSDLVIVAIIGAVGLVLSALIGLGGIIIGLRVSRKVDAIHIELNSRLSDLIALTGTAEHAKGVIEGTSAEVARAGAVGTPDG